MNVRDRLQIVLLIFNPFVPNAPLLYRRKHQKTVFCYFKKNSTWVNSCSIHQQKQLINNPNVMRRPLTTGLFIVDFQ